MSKDKIEWKKPSMGLQSIFTFGAHKGKQVEDLIEDRPNYIAWCVENDIVDFEFVPVVTGKEMAERMKQ